MSIAAKTLVIVLSLFLLAGIALLLSEAKKKEVDVNLRERYFSWYIIAPVLLIPAYYGGWPFAILVLGLCLWSLREFFGVVHLDDTPIFRWLGRFCGFAIVMSAFWETTAGFSYQVHGQSEHLHLFYIMPVLVIMLVLTVPIVLQRYEGMLVKEAFTIFGILYFGWLLGHLVFLRNLPDGFGYLIVLSMAVVLNDVLAYTFGRLFGKHKLCPSISPKKTWEGALGGLVGSLLAVLLFRFAVPQLSLWQLVLASLIIGIAAPLGDLIISVIKRDMGVKDSGTLIPGHGGLLDRCDSLIFATPAFYYYLLCLNNLHF